MSGRLIAMIHLLVVTVTVQVVAYRKDLPVLWLASIPLALAGLACTLAMP